MREINYRTSAAQCIFLIIPHNSAKVEGWSECRSRWQATLDSFTAIFCSFKCLCFSFDLQILSLMFHLLSLTVFKFNFPSYNFCWVEFVLSTGLVTSHIVKSKTERPLLSSAWFTSNKIPTTSLQRISPCTIIVIQ